jgi:hypothetical protein
VEQKNILSRSGVFSIMKIDAIDGNKMIVIIRVRHFPIGKVLDEKTAGDT